jgi:hypothetical protein
MVTNKGMFCSLNVPLKRIVHIVTMELVMS